MFAAEYGRADVCAMLTNSEGGMKFKEEGVVWNLYVNDIVWSENSGTFLWDGKPCDKHPAISKLIPFILEGIPCEAVLIKEYEENFDKMSPEERAEVNKAIGRYNGILMKKGIEKVDESIDKFIDRLPSLFEGFMSAFEEEMEKLEDKIEKLEEKYED